jgi:hypothetical protein
MMELPRIRIEVERMKYNIMHVFSNHNEELEKLLDEQLAAAIENYPFAEQVAKTANEVITEVIQRTVQEFLMYGEGRKSIEDVVLQALSGLTPREADEKAAGENSSSDHA